MTIGDVLAVISMVMLVGAAWAATILVAALAFPAKVAQTEATLTASPGRCVARGAAVVAAVGLLAAVFANGPGPVKLLSALLLSGLGIVAALGSAAMVRLLGRRIDAMGSPLAPFASLTRASVLYVVAGFLPGIGWFAVMPIALLLAVGSGVTALRREKKPAPLPVPYEAIGAA